MPYEYKPAYTGEFSTGGAIVFTLIILSLLAYVIWKISK